MTNLFWESDYYEHTGIAQNITRYAAGVRGGDDVTGLLFGRRRVKFLRLCGRRLELHGPVHPAGRLKSESLTALIVVVMALGMMTGCVSSTR